MIKLFIIVAIILFTFLQLTDIQQWPAKISSISLFLMRTYYLLSQCCYRSHSSWLLLVEIRWGWLLLCSALGPLHWSNTRPVLWNLNTLPATSASISSSPHPLTWPQAIEDYSHQNVGRGRLIISEMTTKSLLNINSMSHEVNLNQLFPLVSVHHKAGSLAYEIYICFVVTSRRTNMAEELDMISV